MRNTLLFAHIPKTSGTSFRKGAEFFFGKDKIYYDYSTKAKETIEVRNQRLVQRIATLEAYLKQQSIETSTNASDSQFDNTETLKEANLGESRKRDMG